MSHEIYELAHSPCRHNLFISVKTFSSIDAASLLWTEYSGGESSLWEPTLLPKSFIFSFDWLFHVSAVLPGCRWLGWSAYLFIPVVPSSSLFFWWTAHKTGLSDWLVLRRLWIRCTRRLDRCWGGKQPFLRIRFSLMQSMGEKRSKENAEWVVLVEFLSGKSPGAQVLNLYFPIQRGEHTSWQGSLLILRLVSPPFSSSLSVAADYDVHSFLSSWFWLASNQWRAPVSCTPCYYCPDYIRVHYWRRLVTLVPVLKSLPVTQAIFILNWFNFFKLIFTNQQTVNRSSQKIACTDHLFGYPPYKRQILIAFLWTVVEATLPLQTILLF